MCFIALFHREIQPSPQLSQFDVMALLRKLCAEWHNIFPLSLMKHVTPSTASVYYRKDEQTIITRTMLLGMQSAVIHLLNYIYFSFIRHCHLLLLHTIE